MIVGCFRSDTPQGQITVHFLLPQYAQAQIAHRLATHYALCCPAVTALQQAKQGEIGNSRRQQLVLVSQQASLQQPRHTGLAFGMIIPERLQIERPFYAYRLQPASKPLPYTGIGMHGGERGA